MGEVAGMGKKDIGIVVGISVGEGSEKGDKVLELGMQT